MIHARVTPDELAAARAAARAERMSISEWVRRSISDAAE